MAKSVFIPFFLLRRIILLHILNLAMNAEVNTRAEAPNIWTYLDAASYLRDLYTYQKSARPKFSYAVWSNELQVRSRSFLRLILVGKRSLTEEMATHLAKHLALNTPERAYFVGLAKLAQASRLNEKEMTSRELQKLRQKFALPTLRFTELRTQDLYEYYASYKMPRLQTLLMQPEITKTAANLSAILKMKASEVVQHLQVLEQLGLAKAQILDSETHWESLSANLQTPDRLGHIALQSYHRKSLEEAINAIDSNPSERRYQSLVLALAPEQLESLQQDLRTALEQVLAKYGSPAADFKLYQINLNSIPVSDLISRSMQVESSPAVDSVSKESYEKPI